jgi:hypothetical protein
MESSIPAGRRFSLKTQFLLLTLGCLFMAAIFVLKADFRTGPWTGLIVVSALGIACVSGGLIGFVIGKNFGRTKTGLILGLFVAMGYLSCILVLHVLNWQRAMRMQLDCCREISYLTDLAEPFTRIL